MNKMNDLVHCKQRNRKLSTSELIKHRQRTMFSIQTTDWIYVMIFGAASTTAAQFKFSYRHTCQSRFEMDWLVAEKEHMKCAMSTHTQTTAMLDRAKKNPATINTTNQRERQQYEKQITPNQTIICVYFAYAFFWLVVSVLSLVVLLALVQYISVKWLFSCFV